MKTYLPKDVGQEYMSDWYSWDTESVSPFTNYFEERGGIEYDKEGRPVRAIGDTKIMLSVATNIGALAKGKLEYHAHNSLEEYYAWLRTIKSSVFFTHNLGWDGDFLIKYLMNVEQIPVKTTITPDDEEEAWKAQDDNIEDIGFAPMKDYVEIFKGNTKTIYAITLRLKTGLRNDITHIWRCSQRLLSASVDDLAKGLLKDAEAATKFPFLKPKHLEEDKQTYFYENDDRPRSFYNLEPQATLNDWFRDDYHKRFFEYCVNDTVAVAYALLQMNEMIKGFDFIKRYDREKQLEWFKAKSSGKKSKDKKAPRAYEPFSCKLTASANVLGLYKISVSQYLDDKYNHSLAKKNRIKWKDRLTINPETYNKACEGYYGGWTQFNPDFVGKVTKVKNGVVADFSSMYPAQMAKPLPYGEFLAEEPEGIEGEDYIEFVWVEVKELKLKKSSYNVLTYRNWINKPLNRDVYNKLDKDTKLWVDNQRYLRDCKIKHQACYTREEWELIKQFYDIKHKELYSLYALCENYLEPINRLLYDKKREYKHLGMKAFEQMVKILLNSGYGSQCKRAEFPTHWYLDDKTLSLFEGLDINDRKSWAGKTYTKEWETKNGEHHWCKYTITSTNELNDIGSLRWVTVKIENWKPKDKLPNKMAGWVITSRARVALWRDIRKIGCKYFYQSDTDSYMMVNLTDKLVKMVREEMTVSGDNVDLGLVELEKTMDAVISYGAKKYCMWKEVDGTFKEVKSGFAGLSKNNIRFKNPMELWSEQYKAGLINGKDLELLQINESQLLGNKWVNEDEEGKQVVDMTLDEVEIQSAVLYPMSTLSGKILVPVNKQFKAGNQ